jgi:hypothetical protein
MPEWPEGGFALDETRPLPYSWGYNRTMIPVNNAPPDGATYLKGLYACVWNEDGEVNRMHFSPDGVTWLEMQGHEYA